MKVSDVVAWAQSVAPVELAEGWDNVGLLVGDPAMDVQRILLTIDYTADVAEEARQHGANLVLCYHPPIFQGLKKITAGSVVFNALRDNVALYSFHTALDVAVGGTNEVLAEALGLSDVTALRPTPGATDGRGMGRIGKLPATSRKELITRIKNALELSHVLVAGPLDGEARTAAVCAGSCGDCLDDALRQGADLYLTGELRHHDALKAASRGMTVVCTLHSNSERKVLPRLKDQLGKRFPDVQVRISEQDRDPFTWQ